MDLIILAKRFRGKSPFLYKLKLIIIIQSFSTKYVGFDSLFYVFGSFLTVEMIYNIQYEVGGLFYNVGYLPYITVNV